MHHSAKAISVAFVLIVWFSSACTRYSDIASSDKQVVSAKTYTEIYKIARNLIKERLWKQKRFLNPNIVRQYKC